jgi:hypothetical protein
MSTTLRTNAAVLASATRFARHRHFLKNSATREPTNAIAEAANRRAIKRENNMASCRLHLSKKGLSSSCSWPGILACTVNRKLRIWVNLSDGVQRNIAISLVSPLVTVIPVPPACWS